MLLSHQSQFATHLINQFANSYGLAYALVSSELLIVQASPNFHILTSQPQTSMTNQYLPDLFWEFVGAEKELQAVLAGEKATYTLERVQRDQPDGSAVYLTIRVTRTNDDILSDKGLLVIIEDTTLNSQLEQRLLQERNELRLVKEELLEANAKLDTLNHFKTFVLSMVAHDMRSPLTAIRGFVELLAQDPKLADFPVQIDMLSTIKRQVDQIQLLLKNLLDLGQDEQGQLQISFSECDLNALVQQVVQAAEVEAKRYKIDLSVSFQESALLLQADPVRVQQILQNLLSNAIKYTQSGGKVTVTTRLNDATAIIKIADTGRGISKSQLANLFQLYYRTDDARQSKAEGSGLGLYIVRRLVEAHNAQISVESTPDKGSTFTLQFPIRQPP